MSREKLDHVLSVGRECVGCILPVWIGAWLMRNYIHGEWPVFWVLLVVATVLVGVNVSLGLNRIGAVELVNKVPQLFESANDAIETSVRHNLRAMSVLRALVGAPPIRIEVSVEPGAETKLQQLPGKNRGRHG